MAGGARGAESAEEILPLRVPVTENKPFVEAKAWHDVKKIMNIKSLLCARQMLHLILAVIEMMCARQMEALFPFFP